MPTMTPFAFLSWPARPGAIEERPDRLLIAPTRKNTRDGQEAGVSQPPDFSS